VYASYRHDKQHPGADGFPVYPTVANGTIARVGVGGSGTAWSLGHAFIWSPAPNFDIGLELTYLRAKWDEAAVRTIGTAPAAGATTANYWGNYVGSYTDSAFVGKLRVQRDF
jgi:hypothetical protein